MCVYYCHPRLVYQHSPAVSRNLCVHVDIIRRDDQGVNGYRSQASRYPNVPIYGGSDKVSALTKLVKDKEEFTLGDNIHVK